MKQEDTSHVVVPSRSVCKTLKPTENMENNNTIVHITQIEHSLSYASFAIVRKETITDRIEIPVCTPFLNPIMPYLIPDTITILMLILVPPVQV